MTVGRSYWQFVPPRTFVLLDAEGRRVGEVRRVIETGKPVRYVATSDAGSTSDHADLKSAMAAAEAPKGSSLGIAGRLHV